MPNFKCSNIDCSYSVSHARIKYRNVEGKLVPDMDPYCPTCGDFLIQDLAEGPIEELSIAVGRFNSLSKAEQKEALHKRSQDHFKKHHKKEVEQKRHDTINNIKNKFENGQ